MAELPHGHLFRLSLVCALAYATLASMLPIPQMILIENGLLLSIAAGVLTSYAPIAWHALRAASPSRGHWHGLGIWFAFFSCACVRVMSIFMRNFGYPDIVNTHWRTLAVAPMLLGGVLVIWAPDAEQDHRPEGRWIRLGLIVGAGVLIICILAGTTTPK